MGTSKVSLFGNTLIDLRDVTVTEEHLLEGATAHDKYGEAIEGAARPNYEKEILHRTYAGDYENDELTSIGACAFYGNTALTSVDCPNVTSIGGYAFNGCTKFTSADFSNVTSIGSYAFNGCTSLKNISDISYTTTIGNHTFYNCNSLEGIGSFYVADRIGPTGSSNTFYGCSHLIYFVMPNLGKSKAGDWNTYQIFGNTFENCTSLLAVDVYSPCKIEVNCFKNASIMNILIIRDPSSTISLSNISSFTGTPFASGGTGGTLYVPESKISNYESATNWSTILSYENNKILPIEGSEYEHYYADGTEIGGSS